MELENECLKNGLYTIETLKNDIKISPADQLYSNVRKKNSQIKYPKYYKQNQQTKLNKKLINSLRQSANLSVHTTPNL